MTQKHLESTRGMERYRAEKAGNVADEAARRVEAHKAAALSDFRARLRYERRRFDPGGQDRLRAALALALVEGADIPRLADVQAAICEPLPAI